MQGGEAEASVGAESRPTWRGAAVTKKGNNIVGKLAGLCF
jgi:hypothetical protein